jgi:hypothetical protein
MSLQISYEEFRKLLQSNPELEVWSSDCSFDIISNFEQYMEGRLTDDDFEDDFQDWCELIQTGRL